MVFGSDDGTSEGQNAESAVLYSVNPQTGAGDQQADGTEGRYSFVHRLCGRICIFHDEGGRLYRAAIDASGNLGELKYFDMGYMSTGTPVCI